MGEVVKIELPDHVTYIIRELSERGYEAYAVGGCIRDTLLGRKPGDWDITTSASPTKVKQIFPRTIDTGIAHGTVTVMLEKCGCEVTTYRVDGIYEDGRHPKTVEFTASLEEDLKRRDFTINAMAYNEKSGLVDIFHGIDDLGKKVICCVGSAKDRFTEDALRMLRAVRFAAQLGFTLEESTINGICLLAPRLAMVSKERIQAELTKILLSLYPQRIEDIFLYGLAGQIFPGLVEYYKQADKKKMQRLLMQAEQDIILRYTAFFTIIQETPAERYRKVYNILKELRFDNHTIDFVSRLSEYYNMELSKEKATLRKQIVEVGEDIFPYLLKFQQEKEIERLYQEIIEAGDCLSIGKLAINGKDLMEAGVAAGKGMGELLNQLLYRVLEKPEWNTKEKLLGLVKENRK